MGHAVPDITADDIGFVCDDPTCELARGPLGLTAPEIQARVLALRAKPPQSPGPDDADDEDDEDESDELDEEEADDDPADPTSLDPLGQGAPCPLCHAAQPPRNGKLLAIANRGLYARLLAATTGFFGLQFWQLVESDSKTGTNRLLDAQRRALGETTKSKATNSFVIGRKVITAVVLKELPFDGHLLRYGNRDADVYEFIEVETKGKKKRKTKGWAKGEAKYGIEQGPPGPQARANPVYIRELQEDLIWLGYLSTSRGNPVPGKFDVFTLGAVLGFKQDLLEVYGVASSPKRLSVAPGSLRAGEFSTAIWSQPAFISPVRIMLDWHAAVRGGKKQKGVRALAAALARDLKNKLAKAKTTKNFRTYLARLEKQREALEDVLASWPHLAALEAVDKPFLPFAPKAAMKSVDQLAPVPRDKQPKHADAKALAADPVWSSDEYNARAKNRQVFLADLRELVDGLEDAIDDAADARGRLDDIAPPPEVSTEWDKARTPADTILARVYKLLTLVRFWVLDSPTQIAAWLTHIIDMGTVDQPTAVYLKALREGGKIGAGRRPAYQLQPLSSKDDFANADEGAKHLRDECTRRPRNQPGAKCETMPEIVALQFFGNESGLKFTHGLAPFNTRAEDKSTRLVLMGIDTNAHRKGSFDAVYHAGGDWYWSRGWGVGQATEGNGKLDGVELRRGLPILPAGADAIRHPRAYVDHKESVTDAMERKILAKYDARTARRDCTYGKAMEGSYYDCHSCLKRFFDAGLTGAGEYGKGGVFVPIGKNSIGATKKATGFFVDLERYTPFARGADGVEDPAGTLTYFRLFGIKMPDVDPNVATVLRRMDGKTTLGDAVKRVSKELALDPGALRSAVDAHVTARAQLPCSWLLVRIRYAGTGEQAFSSLTDLLNVVGNLDSTNATLIKHIKEASELRRKS